VIKILAAALFVAGCSNAAGGGDPPGGDAPEARAHDPRFVGLWAVEQPAHALYEVTYYDFGADGSLRAVLSDPADCTGHLEEHCVTGSVANCVAADGSRSCEATVTCVFGDTWFSRSPSTLVILGSCSDAVAREIVLELAADPAQDSEWGGAGGVLVTVGGEPGWSHDNWDWAFRKCRAGTDSTTCVP
jgi:hypothetical protein